MSGSGNILVELEGGQRREITFSGVAHSLADVLAAHGLPLNTRCGGRGLCRGCEVELRAGTAIVGGELVAAPAHLKACQACRPGALTRRQLTAPANLGACPAQLEQDAVIFVPARSRLEHRPQVGESFEIGVSYAHQPLFSPLNGTRDTAFAVDAGTTTVVVLLVDLTTGEVLSSAGAFNAQIRFGDNVITRIAAARSPGSIAAMQRAMVQETIQPLLLRACEQAGREPMRIAGGAIAGNTTMLHLLVGEDPTSLGVAPFTPRFIGGRQVSAAQIGLHLPGLVADTPIQLLPGVAAYIGADITAGVIATGMIFDEKPSLLVDIGTNGEIVLQSDGKLFGCATAAGPAFEGCGLRCGIRAADGAVSVLNLRLNPFALETKVIGNLTLAQATGICGSAYLDFLATARQAGLLTTTGRFDLAAWEGLPEQNRLTQGREHAFRLVPANGADGLVVSEVDVALLLQAKAAIGAGIEVLLETAGLRAADIGRVCLAGGFGMHLNVAHAIAIGLLPGFREDQVRVVGNSSLAGALLALVDRTTLDEMEELRARVQIMELNLVGDFENRYIEHLLLP